MKRWLKCHIGKTELQKGSIYFYIVFNITYFSHQMCTVLYIMSKKNDETNHFQYKYTFYDQDHICCTSNFYYNYTTRKLNFWLWNKTAYM